MVLVSSFSETPSPQFEGYCWVGADLIVGREGIIKHRDSGAVSVTVGLDGCYMYAEYKAGKWEVGTDSRGLSTTFLYQSGEDWAISSSFAALVEHVRSNGGQLTPRLGVLAALGVPRAFADQLTSSATAFEEIVLVPSFATVTIESNDVQVQASLLKDEVTYEETLFRYISLWRDRFSTISSNEESYLHADLSGGIDSRTVLSFALADENFRSGSDHFSIGSAKNREVEYGIASQIVEHYGLALSPQRGGRNQNNQERAMETWRASSLGVYLPLYLDGGHLDPARVHAHGAGGGNFRPHYVGDAVLAPIERCRRHLDSRLYEEWKELTIESSRALEKERPNVHPLILHYREFRNRFHFGHKPRSTLMYTPLESGLTDSLTDRDDHRDERQLYFDIMETLAPGLKDFPFDNPAKAATPDINKNITIVDLEEPRPGRVYGKPVPPNETERGAAAYEAWINQGSEALGIPEVSEFIGQRTKESALSSIEDFRTNGTRQAAHRRSLMDVSYAQTVQFVLGV